jgi:hypothetical protein
MSNSNVGDEAEDFFQSSPPEDIDASENNLSDKEADSFYNFNGQFANFQEYLEHEKFTITKLNNQSERKLREENAERAYYFSFKWAIFICVLILLYGFGGFIWEFKLSQTEFMFIIGSLTTSIFAFYVLVLKYLFNKDSNYLDSML